MTNYNLNRAFKEFKSIYPNLVTRGITFQPDEDNPMSIIIFAPNVGKMRYDIYSKRVSWIEYWEREKVRKERIKEEKMEQRFNMYNNFLDKIDIYRKETGATQEYISEKTGISRWSLSKYLNKTRIPKIITMKHICESLGIDI